MSSCRIYSMHFLQKVWPLQFVNQAKWIKQAVASCDVNKLNMSIFTLYLPHNLQRRVLVSCNLSLCNWDTVSNRTYQNFRDKRLVRLASKCPNWQRSQRTSYKAKFSQRYNIYLVHLKCNITCQNIRGETKVRSIFIPWNA